MTGWLWTLDDVEVDGHFHTQNDWWKAVQNINQVKVAVNGFEWRAVILVI